MSVIKFPGGPAQDELTPAEEAVADPKPFGVTTEAFEALMKGEVCTGFIVMATAADGSFRFQSKGKFTDAPLMAVGALELVKDTFKEMVAG